MPVPSVSTSSVPTPSITASPWTPASLATRAGLPVSFSSASASSKPSHAGSRLGAVSVCPFTTTPGKPAATRSKGGICFTISAITASTASGRAGRGVSRRTRSLVGRSAASAVKPLIPVPPMSRQKVISGPVFLAIPAPPLGGRRRDYGMKPLDRHDQQERSARKGSNGRRRSRPAAPQRSLVRYTRHRQEETVKPVIRSLTLKGYRSFESARIEFDNPTFLVGQNGSGKSNLVDALAFIGEAMTTPLHSVMTRRGGISTLCHRSPASNGLPHFGLALELENPSEEISSAQYGFEIQTLPQRWFQVKRDPCVITGSAGRIYFDRSEDPEGSSSSSFRNLIPITDSSSLVLPLVGGHKAFAPVVHALSAMRAYAIEPGRLRRLQDPDGTTNLRGDG